ncbi:MAG TPA: hypothetical protein VIT67_03530, partial [Povalibacter sp.]
IVEAGGGAWASRAHIFVGLWLAHRCAGCPAGPEPTGYPQVFAHDTPDLLAAARLRTRLHAINSSHSNVRGAV